MQTVDQIFNKIKEIIPETKSSLKLFLASYISDVQQDAYREGTEKAAEILLGEMEELNNETKNK